MDFLSAIVGPVVESLLVPVKKHLGYLLSSTKHVRNMSNKMKQLHGASDDVKKHMETNTISNLEIPARVPDWLEEVEKIEKDAERISSNVNGCFNLKMRYQAGRKAFKITEVIEGLVKENIETSWSDAQKPLGKLSFKKASTSAPSDGDAQNDFKSREKIFKEALCLLQQDQKAQVIALCGMGGVGKTTMMEQLKKAVEDKKMFDWVVKVVIGQKINTFSIQQTVAEYLGHTLTESSKTARADRLRTIFGKISQESKKKVLVILDDVWEMVDLKDIGLSPLPNGFKLLLTSRNEKVCRQIAVQANLDVRVVRVDVMEKLEANNFFFQITGVSKENDPDLNDIGVEIVRRCGFLPLAIKLIATALNSQEKFVWRNTLHRLKGYDLDENVQEIIEISYTFIREEDVKAIFLLCGLFPDDYNIPIEDLTRYVWGLKLLNAVPTPSHARDRTKTCVLNLKNANLLMDSDYRECVKMHDLVLAFVVGKVSKGDHPWIINHGDVSNWSIAEMSDSCRRISLTCMGMSEFPRDFNHPNVSLLRLMNGDKSLKFPEDFYEKMENVQVIAYEKLQYPSLPRSLQCSAKLTTLCLHECLLMFDCSPIGDHLLNLEVLSFAHSGIRYLPSAIGNLKKLKLLDLTGCIDLRIHEGVLKNLVKLEELYMRVADMRDKKGVRFTDIIYKELEERSKNLSALEVEYFEKNPQSMNMSYNKLERFKISMGRFLEPNTGKYMHSARNTLMLVANKDEVLESGMNELFQKTEVLHLKAVGGMNNLVEVLPKSVPQQSFVMLRVLRVSKCGDLRYLFTVPVASGLVKLERVVVWECPVMEALVYSENGEEGVDIRFQELKYLELRDLPRLVGLSNSTNDVIHLPQLVTLELGGLPNFTSIYPEYKSATSSVMSSSSSSSAAIIKPFFNKEVMIPKLETLWIQRMEALKNIWACESIISSEEVVDACCLLREISVRSCDNLVNMFPRNPMPLLHHLETINVGRCGSIEVLFDIDDVGEIKEEGGSKLRFIHVHDAGKLREVWRLKCVINEPDVIIRGFQAVERIDIDECKRFRNIFTPTTARFDLGALTDIDIDTGGDDEESKEENNESVEERNQKIDDISKGQIIQVADNIPYVAYPFRILPTFHHLKSLNLSKLTDVEAVFEIESATSRDLATTWDNQRPPVLPNLENLELSSLKKMNCVWKCTWNHFLYSQKQRESSFQNLTSISLKSCGKIKYLFSPLMVKLLFNLKTIGISECDSIEEVVSNRDDDIQTMAASTSSSTNITFFRHLDSLDLSCLSKLKYINDGAARGNESEITSNVISNISIHENFKSSGVDVVSWSLCQYSRKIKISECNELSTEGDSNNSCHVTDVDDERGNIRTAVTIPRLANTILLELPNLMILRINQCDLLEHVFTSSTLESLKQLKELNIEDCKAMQVIVKEDDLKEDGEHTTSKVVVFPHLKSLTLTGLPNVKGFFLGMKEFRWPQLDEVKIYGCPKMMVFTSGHSKTPKLNYMHTGLGKHSLECGLNFQLTNTSHETQSRSSSMCSTPDMIKLLQYPWSFSTLVEVDVSSYSKLLESRIIFPCNELNKLQNLEKLNVTLPRYYYRIMVLEEVFEVVEETSDYTNETQSSVVVFPKLKEVTLENLKSVRHIWKSNRWIVLNFPNLTKVLINGCPLLGHVFTCCMVGSLLQLQELHISDCDNMEVIVKQVEDSDTRTNEVVVFPNLKSLTLTSLKNLKGFYLGLEAFMWPLLDTLEIKDCPQITAFTCGQSTTPELKVIGTSFGLCYATEDPTSFIKTKQQEGLQF